MKKGMTLIELLIGITIASLIFIFSTNAMYSFFYNDTKSKGLEAIEQTKNDLYVELANKIRWGESISVDNPNGQITVDNIQYRLEDRVIKRDGEPITPESVIIESFKIDNYSTDAEYESLEIEFEFKNRSLGDTIDTFSFVVSRRKLEIELEDD